MTKQILKIILSLGAVALSLLCCPNAEKLFVKNLRLATIPSRTGKLRLMTNINDWVPDSDFL